MLDADQGCVCVYWGGGGEGVGREGGGGEREGGLEMRLYSGTSYVYIKSCEFREFTVFQ